MADLYNSDPQQLASLLSIEAAAADPSNVWRPEELAAILRHQLAVPLGEELGERVHALGRELELADKYHGLASRTFGELLFEPAPPVEALDLIKQFAKAARARKDSLVPPEVATVLYYASILLARHCHGGVSLSSLPEATLLEGGRWILGQPWVGEDVKSLVSELLQPGPADAHPTPAAPTN
jgi:hypothetical protein